MYILTQSKDTVVNISNTKSIYIAQNRIYADNEFLGEYDENRVGEVFKEVMNRIAQGNRVEKIMYTTFDTNDYQIKPCCFEMPEN